MADTTGQQDIRGLDIDKLAKGFATKAFILKNLVQVTSTNAREIRWYQKGISYVTLITGTTTTGMTASPIANVPDKARPSVAEQAWTRQTSYVRKYFIESPLMSEEDLKDADVDVLATNVQDLTHAVANQIDKRIFDVLSESLSPSLIETTAATGTGWDDTTTGNPVLDLLTAKQKISANYYDVSGNNLVCVMNSIEHKNLLNWLITVKGSSIPDVASEKVRSGMVMNLLGFDMYVTETATTDYALQFVRNAATWKMYTPLKSIVMKDEGIGVKIRVLERGEAILVHPKAVHLTTDTVT